MKNMKKALGVALVIGAIAYSMAPDVFFNKGVSKNIVQDIPDRDIDDPEVIRENLSKLKAEREKVMQRLATPHTSLEAYQLLSVRLNQLNMSIRSAEKRLEQA